MKVHIKYRVTVAKCHWNTDRNDPHDEGDVCVICWVSYEDSCPLCKMPGNDCLLKQQQ